jgi:protein involved in polysaccharide export with SLBB domain
MFFRIRTSLRSLIGLLAMIFVVTCFEGAPLRASEHAKLVGATTAGGLVDETQIIRVTSLADNGPGSLREAVAQTGPRVIVFNVAGIIELERDLLISHPFVTIAGQTAPSPGIGLTGAKLRIGTHDVVVQHLSVRPMWVGAIPNNADGISIGTCGTCVGSPENIVLENISVSWGIDENIGIWGDDVSNVTIRNSIIAEALMNAGHEKGAHSMGLLIGDNVKGAEITGNSFVSNNNRNPLINVGASAYISNNLIYNPGANGIHIEPGDGAYATIIGNVTIHGPSTRSNLRSVNIHGNAEFSEIYLEENYCCSFDSTSEDTEGLSTVSEPPVVSRNWTAYSAGEVVAKALRFSGARPSDRSIVDERIVSTVLERQGQIIDSPQNVGGFKVRSRQATESAWVPDPFSTALSLNVEQLNDWLCLKHFDVGGASTNLCPDPRDALVERLSNLVRAKQGEESSLPPGLGESDPSLDAMDPSGEAIPACWPGPGDESSDAGLKGYWLAPNDRIRVSVYERPELSGDFLVRDDGTVSIPLFGAVSAYGKEVGELEQELSLIGQTITGRPLSLSLELSERRPVFVLGHVIRPGAIPFQPGMTVLKSIAMSGGVYRVAPAADNVVDISREAARLGSANEERKQNIARLARLNAQIEGSADISVPNSLTRIEDADRAAELIEAEQQVMDQQRQVLDTEIKARDEAIALAEEAIVAMEQRAERTAVQIEIAQQELARAQDLVDRGLGRRGDLFTIQRIVAGLEADDRDLAARIANAKGALVTAKRDRNLAEVQYKLSLQEERNAVESALASNNLSVRYSRRIVQDLTNAPLDSDTQDSLVTMDFKIVRETLDGPVSFAASSSSLLCPDDVVNIRPLQNY